MHSSSTCYHIFASLSFFDLQPQSLTPFSRQDHSPSLTYDHTNTLFAIDNYSIVSFKPNMSIKSLALFIFELYFIDCSHRGFVCPLTYSDITFPGMLHLHTELLALHCSCKQPFSVLQETSFHTVIRYFP